MRRSIALSFVISLFVAANVFAVGEGRMTGKVLDAATKAGIENAVIKIEAVEGKTFKTEVKTKKDGGFTIFVLDGTLKYKFTVTAPDYAPYEENVKFKLGETNVRDFELRSGTAAPAATATGGVGMAEAKGDPAVDVYNQGAALANSGDTAGAIAKFEEAVTIKPDLTAGWMALAKANLKAKQYQKAVDAAKKALEVDDSDSAMWTVLYQSYIALGDKANAQIAEAKLPANPSALFNQAARAINQGKDADAEKLLKDAVAADESFAKAWYELGMVYVRSGKNAEAKEALNKYLTLEPTGADAPTAKEMLNYIK